MLQFFNLTHRFARAHFARSPVVKQQIANEHKRAAALRLFPCTGPPPANEKPFLFAHVGPAPPMKRPREGWTYLARVTRGYNHGQSCRSLRVPSSGPMKSWRRWALAGWERYIARGTRASSAPSPSKFLPPHLSDDVTLRLRFERDRTWIL